MLVAEIQQASNRITGSPCSFFRHCSLECSNSNDGELRFLRAVLYFYSLLCECGAKPVRFCSNQTPLQKRSATDPQVTLKIVHALRTQVAHSLDASGKDNGLIETASAWFRQQIGENIPRTDVHWTKCHDQFMAVGMELLRNIKLFLAEIESDFEMKEMKEDLREAIEGGIDRVTIESIAVEALDQQGRTDISPGSFCERHFADWSKVLSLKSARTDPRREIRLLIETAITKLPPHSPITTPEMIAALGITRGPLVGVLVLERDRLLRSGVVDRNGLIAKLADYLRTLQSSPPDGT